MLLPLIYLSIDSSVVADGCQWLNHLVKPFVCLPPSVLSVVSLLIVSLICNKTALKAESIVSGRAQVRPRLCRGSEG